MKKSICTRLVSLLLCIAVICSLFAAMFTVSAATYSYNPGKRGTVCTSLSSSARSYYTGSYAYSTLSAKSASSIKSSLKSLMTNTQSKTTSYSELRTLTKYTDANAGSSSKIALFYSNSSVSGTWDSGSTWNREHVWCQSLGTFTTSKAGSDIHHLRPADPRVNSTRNNLPFGEVSGSYKTATTNSGVAAGYYTSSCFEPLDNVKGDVARILLYVYTRWGESNLTDLITSVDLLQKWCMEDPVDAWEMGRNDVIEQIQGNRNVFIDYPEYAWLMFGDAVPSTLTSPSRGAGSSGSTDSGNTGSGSTDSGNTGSGSTTSGTVADGQYVIAAKVGSTYYAMSNSFASKITGKAITVSNGKVSASDASDYAVTFKKSGSYYTISNGSTYLKYSSSTNLASSTSAYNWSIGEGTNGSYRITATTATTRGIVFQKSYTRFGAYALSNASAGSTSYYDVELLPVTGSTSSSGSSDSSDSGNSSGSAGNTGSSSGYTITLSVDGSISTLNGTTVTLPTPTSFSGYTFVGWATSAITSKTSTKPTLYAAGNTYSISGDITLYAIYSYKSWWWTYYTSNPS